MQQVALMAAQKMPGNVFRIVFFDHGYGRVGHAFAKAISRNLLRSLMSAQRSGQSLRHKVPVNILSAVVAGLRYSKQ